MNTVAMIDAIHLNVQHVPVTAPKVAGYVTGSPDIKWTDADWGRFPRSGHVRIEQGFGMFDPLHCDVFDVEAGAVTPDMAARGVADRIATSRGTTIYASRDTLPAVESALDAHLASAWHGHVDCWLADWNLDEAEGAALVGSMMNGMKCRAVQWASPSSNPRTLIPGTTLTLAEAGCDLSEADETWHPAPVIEHTEIRYMAVRLPDGASRMVVSKDGGKTMS